MFRFSVQCSTVLVIIFVDVFSFPDFTHSLNAMQINGWLWGPFIDISSTRPSEKGTSWLGSAVVFSQLCVLALHLEPPPTTWGVCMFCMVFVVMANWLGRLRNVPCRMLVVLVVICLIF